MIWVELTQFLVESSQVKLKIYSIQLKLSWKCEQLNFESSWIQNVNSKLDLMISLYLNRAESRLDSNFIDLRLQKFAHMTEMIETELLRLN